MRQYPIFVKAGDEHVAAIATAPAGDPVGLVLLLAGTGRHNVIGSTLSGYLSERLAVHGLACLRLDYAGVGDSSGTVPAWTPSDVDAAARQARAALAEVREAFDVSRFVSVGTCFGSRVALTLTEDPGCVGAICLAPPLSEGGTGRAARPYRPSRLKALVRSNPLLRRMILAPLRALRGAQGPAPRLTEFLSRLDRVRILLLYGKNPKEDHWSPRVQRSIEATVATLPPEQQARLEVRMLQSGPLTRFDGLPHADQAAIVDVLVPEVRACFGEDDFGEDGFGEDDPEAGLQVKREASSSF